MSPTHQDLSNDTTFDPCYLSLDSTFKDELIPIYNISIGTLNRDCMKMPFLVFTKSDNVETFAKICKIYLSINLFLIVKNFVFSQILRNFLISGKFSQNLSSSGKILRECSYLQKFSWKLPSQYCFHEHKTVIFPTKYQEIKHSFKCCQK